MTVDAAALHDVLTALEVQLGRVRRHLVSGDDLLPLAPGTTSVGYVVSGEVTADATGLATCTLDAVTGRTTATADAPLRALRAGDAFIAGADGPAVLATRCGAEVVVADVVLAWPAGSRALPPFTWVSGFAQLEPAAAALAAHLGPSRPSPASSRPPLPDATGPDAPGCSRPGDGAVCRVMVTTVVLSVVRAWAQVGCAPDGWPRSGTDDPHLSRAAAAVLEDPGRDWTVEQLAGVAAMSRSTFAERFRAAYGLSPASFVTEVRMRRAMRLLEAGTPVHQASRALGYGSEDGFSRAFRRHAGAPPSQWRARQRASAPRSAAPRSAALNSTVPASSSPSATP